MSAHREHWKRQGIATECTAHHVNYGGGCLNCGYQPPPTPMAPAASGRWEVQGQRIMRGTDQLVCCDNASAVSVDRDAALAADVARRLNAEERMAGLLQESLELRELSRHRSVASLCGDHKTAAIAVAQMDQIEERIRAALNEAGR